MDWFLFTLGALSTFRLALLVSKEDGPYFIFRKIRKLPEKGSATKEGLSCQWCVSMYAAALVTAFYFWDKKIEPRYLFIYCLSFSTAAIIINQTFTRGAPTK